MIIPPRITIHRLLMRSATYPMGVVSNPLTQTASITRMPMAVLDKKNSESAKTGHEPPYHADTQGIHKPERKKSRYFAVFQ